jgi:hypothetical protein
MLAAAFTLLSIAVLFGCILAVLDMRTGAATPLWPLAALHGLSALAGFACLLLALRGPARGLDQGTASFGTISAWLLGVAALFAMSLLTARLRGRQLPGLVMGMHATFAVIGFVMLLAYFLS